MSALLDIVRGAKRPERSVSLCLRGDLVAQFEALEKQLAEAIDADAQTFGGSGESKAIADRMESLRTEMSGAIVTFNLRSIGAFASATLTAEHAPRPDQATDKALGYNPTGLYPAVVVACCYSLERDGETVILRDEADEATDAMSAEDWAGLFKVLSQSQFDELFGTAWMLDRGDVAVPTSALASRILAGIGEGSKLPDAGESAPDASTAGSRPARRRTSTTSKAE